MTDRGRLVARLVPPEADDRARERLIAAERLLPAVAPLRLPERVDDRPSGGWERSPVAEPGSPAISGRS